jgi:iron complex outermembrane receptor protein
MPTQSSPYRGKLATKSGPERRDIRGRASRAALVCIALIGGLAVAAPVQLADIADLTLEQLANIEVTSVSGRAERLSDAPASIFVITAEDIRRSTATTLPQALRLAPNLQIARVDANQYAVSARGSNQPLANKLLVLIDGRTVYTPLFSGVFWEAQDVMLEDVERIEVISGPGATLWGSNAVNGVINVITRSAAATQGTLFTAAVGNREKGTALRYGGELSSGGHYRVYGRLAGVDTTRLANGTDVRDASGRGQAGFRADWDGAVDKVTLQGDVYSADIDQGITKREIGGANLIGRWNRLLANGSGLEVQAYYDRTERTHPGVFHEELDTFDAQLKHSLLPLGDHKVLWGAGYRYASDRIGNSAVVAFLPADRAMKWGNVFVQDEMALHKRLTLTLGAKVETNPYTGAEFLPSVRLAWRPSEDKLVWSALSRAVRAPSRIDREFFSPANPPRVLSGGPNFVSEVANVAELGYRAQPTSSFSYSVTAFHHQYERLRSVEVRSGTLMLENNIDGITNGVEAWGNYRVTENWRLVGGLVEMREKLGLKPGGADVASLAAAGNDPRHQWMMRSLLDLGRRVEADLMVRHVSALANAQVPSYYAVDARLGWRPRRDFEASLNVRNLFDPRHGEWGAAATRAEIDRTVFVKLLWRM